MRFMISCIAPLCSVAMHQISPYIHFNDEAPSEELNRNFKETIYAALASSA